jgi:hypothetical protein
MMMKGRFQIVKGKCIPTKTKHDHSKIVIWIQACIVHHNLSPQDYYNIFLDIKNDVGKDDEDGVVMQPNKLSQYNEEKLNYKIKKRTLRY